MKTTNKPFTCIASSHSGLATPTDRAMWEAIRKTPNLIGIAEKINEPGITDEEVRALKSQLPIWTPRCAKFKNNHRAEADAEVLTDILVFDIDEKGRTEDIMVKTNPYLYPCYGPFEIVLIEESIRHGTHVAVKLPAGMTPEEAQREFSRMIGLKVDPVVKSVAGCIYQVPESFTRYVSDRLFIAPPQPSPVGEGVEPGTTNNSTSEKTFEKEENSTPDSELPPSTGRGGECPDGLGLELTSYAGIPWDRIISKYIELFWEGKLPTVGARNAKTFEIACNLRTICDYRQDVLEKIVPKWARFPEDEWRRTIQNALKEPKKGITSRIRQVLAAIRAEVIESSENETGVTEKSLPPTPPKKLPSFLKLIQSKAPIIAKVAVTENIWAAVGTNIHGVKFRYIDNTMHEPTFMCNLIGPQSIGKGYIVKPIEAMLANIRKRDEENRSREAEYKRRNPTGAKKVKEPRPTDIVVQCLSENCTDAAFTQRVIDAQNNGGRFLYLRVDEVEQLRKITSDKRIDSVHLLIRNAFDLYPHGQDRVGSESVSGQALLRWNFNTSTTPVNAVNFWKRGSNDGTLSRMLFSTILREDAENNMFSIPLQGDYDEKFFADLQPYIDRLNSANGVIECPQAERLVKRLVQENAETAVLYDSEAYRILSYRATVLAYLKAMCLYILEGYHWSKDIENYVTWSLKYDLWCKMHYFGAIIEKAIKEEMCLAVGNPRNLLTQLPEEFTKEDFLNLRKRLNKAGDGKSLLSKWKARGFLLYNSERNVFIKTRKAS